MMIMTCVKTFSNLKIHFIVLANGLSVCVRDREYSVLCENPKSKKKTGK